MRLRYVLLIFAVLFAAPVLAQEQQRTLQANLDTSQFDPSAGAVSNGAGEFLFAGLTARSASRRALVAFDLSAIPQGATITGVELGLTMSKTATPAPVDTPVTLHRVLEQWGEGASDAAGEEGTGVAAAEGDATWEHRLFPNETWSTPGGTVDETASASADVGTNARYTWTSSGMVADVQAWVDGTHDNFGWQIRGDESRAKSAKRFNSRENAGIASRPSLVVHYTLSATAIEDEAVPRAAVLGQNHPNPFSHTTTIDYVLSSAQDVDLAVFDLLGRKVAVLAGGRKQAGSHQVTLDATPLPDGVYLYRLETGGSVFTRQLVVLK